jgi:SAM-dependent methyltransferase
MQVHPSDIQVAASPWSSGINETARPGLKTISKWFPEVGAGGFSSLDGTVEFYTRINALLDPSMTLLNFGAGRGAEFNDETCAFRRQLRSFKGKVAKVVACDIDDAVYENEGADEITVVDPKKPLPYANQTFDIIVADFVFEHIEAPGVVAPELHRILKPGGWICARTPNKYCLISLCTRTIRNSFHTTLLRWVQPDRKTVDVFPTVFKLNSKRDVARWFPHDRYDDFTYRYEGEPGYYFNSSTVLGLFLLLNRVLPPFMKTGLHVFLRRR